MIIYLCKLAFVFLHAAHKEQSKETKKDKHNCSAIFYYFLFMFENFVSLEFNRLLFFVGVKHVSYLGFLVN